MNAFERERRGLLHSNQNSYIEGGYFTDLSKVQPHRYRGLGFQSYVDTGKKMVGGSMRHDPFETYRGSKLRV